MSTLDLPTDYEALNRLMHTLLRQDATDESRARLAEVTDRIKQIVAVPPAGYSMPKAAADLLAHAEANGWETLHQWTQPSYTGEPYLSVQLRRNLTAVERADTRGDCWKYKLTWHSRGCTPGRVRLFGSGLAATPDSPAWHDAPSVKGIRAVITAHPASTDHTT